MCSGLNGLMQPNRTFLCGCMGCQGQKVVFLPLSRLSRITSCYDDDVTRIPSILMTLGISMYGHKMDKD